MNEEPRRLSIDSELEARLVAMVLGEASDFERDELQRLLEQRPELAEFKREIEEVHELMQELGKGEAETPEDDWKLPADKRDVVLATFRGESAPEPVRSFRLAAGMDESQWDWRRTIHRIASIAAVVMAIGVLGSLLMLPAMNAAREAASVRTTSERDNSAVAAGAESAMEWFEPADSPEVAKFSDDFMLGYSADGALPEISNGADLSIRDFEEEAEEERFRGYKGMREDGESTAAPSSSLAEIRDSLGSKTALPSPYYLQDDVQYMPATPRFSMEAGGEVAATEAPVAGTPLSLAPQSASAATKPQSNPMYRSSGIAAGEPPPAPAESDAAELSLPDFDRASNTRSPASGIQAGADISTVMPDASDPFGRDGQQPGGAGEPFGGLSDPFGDVPEEEPALAARPERRTRESVRRRLEDLQEQFQQQRSAREGESTRVLDSLQKGLADADVDMDGLADARTWQSLGRAAGDDLRANLKRESDTASGEVSGFLRGGENAASGEEDMMGGMMGGGMGMAGGIAGTNRAGKADGGDANGEMAFGVTGGAIGGGGPAGVRFGGGRDLGGLGVGDGQQGGQGQNGDFGGGMGGGGFGGGMGGMGGYGMPAQANSGVESKELSQPTEKSFQLGQPMDIAGIPMPEATEQPMSQRESLERAADRYEADEKFAELAPPTDGSGEKFFKRRQMLEQKLKESESLGSESLMGEIAEFDAPVPPTSPAPATSAPAASDSSRSQGLDSKADGWAYRGKVVRGEEMEGRDKNPGEWSTKINRQYLEELQMEGLPSVAAGRAVGQQNRDLSIALSINGRLSEDQVSQLYSFAAPSRSTVQDLFDIPTQPAEKAKAKKSKPSAGLNELSAEQEAFSTFSLHVSDVSFKLARAALGSGSWPEADKIRIEEFVNAFDYGDPMPSQNEKVSCRIEQSAHPFLQQRNLMRVSMRTAAAGRTSSTPLRLTLLVDNSGSMERIDRQQTVRRAFATLAQQLQPIDQVTLISFARRPRLLADKVNGGQANQLVDIISDLPSEGGTNIEAALQLAFEKALEQRMDQAQNRVILLTDGAVNLGDADPESLANMITNMRGAGIAFDAAGISAEGLNDEILEALTRKGDGRYYLLDSLEAVEDGFARQIAGALRPSAKNVKVQVQFNPQRVGRYKLLGFEKHRLKKEDFRNDKVDAAEMAAEEAGVAVYQFEAKPDGEGDIGLVSVRFRDLSTGQMVENTWPIPYEAEAPRLDQAAPSLRIAAAAALLAGKLRGEALAETIDLTELSKLVAELPEPISDAARVGQMMQMIQQARQLSN